MATNRPRATTRPPARRRTPPATVVHLVRHGQTPTTGQSLPGRTRGLHLADSGHSQARAVAARFASAPTKPTAVYASPLERTQETALPIARALRRRVRTEQGLLECDFGRWTGAKLVDLAKRPEWRTVQRYPSGFRFPGGESFAEMQARIVDTITVLVARHPGEHIVVVSHADPIKAAIAHALGVHLDLFQRIVISPCSVTSVIYGTDGPTVLGVNTTTGPLTEQVS